VYSIVYKSIRNKTTSLLARLQLSLHKFNQHSSLRQHYDSPDDSDGIKLRIYRTGQVASWRIAEVMQHHIDSIFATVIGLFSMTSLAP